MKKYLFFVMLLLLAFVVFSCNDEVDNVNPFVGVWQYENYNFSVFTEKEVTTYYPNHRLFWTGTYTFNESSLIIYLDEEKTNPDVFNWWNSPVAFTYTFADKYLWMNNNRLLKLNLLPVEKMTGLKFVNSTTKGPDNEGYTFKGVSVIEDGKELNHFWYDPETAISWGYEVSELIIYDKINIYPGEIRIFELYPGYYKFALLEGNGATMPNGYISIRNGETLVYTCVDRNMSETDIYWEWKLTIEYIDKF